MRHILVLFFFILTLTLKSQRLDFYLVVNQGQPVLLDDFTPVKYYIVNPSKRHAIIPDSDLRQLYFYVKKSEDTDTSWRQIGRQRLPDHFVGSYFLEAKDSTWGIEELSAFYLLPNTKYKIKAIYCRKIWTAREPRNAHPEKVKCKPMIAEAEFVTETVSESDQNLYETIRQKKLEAYFLFPLPPKIRYEHRGEVLQLIAEYPDSKFCLNAKYAFIQAVWFTKSHWPDQAVPDQDIPLAQRYGRDLLRAKAFKQKSRVRDIFKEFGWSEK